MSVQMHPFADLVSDLAIVEPREVVCQIYVPALTLL